MPLNFKKLVAIFASKFFRFSGTIGKCAAKPSRAGGFLPLTAFRLNRALVMVLEVKNGNQHGSTLPPGVQWCSSQVTCSSLTPWGISVLLIHGSKMYLGPGPNLVMVLEVKNGNQDGSMLPPGVQCWN